MSETGLKQFSLAFIFSDGGCNPKWTPRALTGGIDQAAIEAIARMAATWLLLSADRKDLPSKTA